MQPQVHQARCGWLGNIGPCALSIAQYLNLIDWTGRQMHPGKRGKIDLERPRIFDRLGLTDRSWTTQELVCPLDLFLSRERC